MTPTRVGQITALLGAVAAIITLIAVTWVGTFTATYSQRAEANARLAADAASQALTYEDDVQRDLLEVNQTLRVLAHAWEADPAQFHLLPWRDQLVALNAISPDIFITDERGIIRDDTVPEAVGSNVANSDYFRALAERIFDDGKMYIGPSTMGGLVREWHINLARPLHHSDGSFAGVIVASMRLGALSSFYQMANIGTHGIIAVVTLDQGIVRVATGVNPIDPGSSIAGTDMFKALQANPDGVWTGRSALDGIERVHAFRRVPDTNLAVIVGVDKAEALSATDARATAAYIFAGAITLSLLSLVAILLHAVRAARRREAVLSRDRAMLASANSELELAKALADNKTAQLEATLAGMTDGVAMVDGEFRLIEWNPRFPEIAGVPASMLRVGLPMEEILRAQAAAGQFGDVDIEAEAARRMSILRSGDIAGTSERMRPDGTVVELRRNRMPDGGFVTLYTDITARKRAENDLRDANARAEVATRATARFVAIVSHEIRTPLNALLNSLRLLADSDMGRAQQTLLDTARQSGEALASLINDVLEMSRMDAGQLSLRPSVFNLHSVIESAIEMFGAQAAERGIALRLSIAGGVPDELYEDPNRLRQVLINLLSNAVKFAASGEVRVIVEAQRTPAASTLRVAVRDRGPVIAPEGRIRLFEPFSRLAEAGDGAPVGTGLGLTICQHLVALMGGEIGCSVWAMGDHAAGNEFWLTLPIKPIPGEPKTPARRDEPPRRLTLPRTRILLVEDIAANQLVTATQLRREGHLVDIASSGPEAISAAASRPYDLILMDIFMPGMSGLETTQRIRALGGPAADLPIVALTAKVSPDDEATCIAAGMNGLLDKPVALPELLDAIARHVWPYRSDTVPMEEAQAATVSSPVLSTSRLEELRATLPADTLASLVEDCLLELAERLASLQEALRDNDAQTILAQSHAMSGMAAEYGMAALEVRLRALMRAIRDEPDTAAALGDELETEMETAAVALREVLRIEMV